MWVRPGLPQPAGCGRVGDVHPQTSARRRLVVNAPSTCGARGPGPHPLPGLRSRGELTEPPARDIFAPRSRASSSSLLKETGRGACSPTASTKKAVLAVVAGVGGTIG